MIKRVLVAHPGLQHSHQLAWALNEADMLCAFWSGVPVICSDGVVPEWLPRQFHTRLKRTLIPREKYLSCPWSPVLHRTVSNIPGGWNAHLRAHWVDGLFDAWAAHRLSNIQPSAVVAYENAALHTFNAARKKGMLRILDAASMHHQVACRLNPMPTSLRLEQINRRKDAEVELADRILTCSPLAAESYLQAGVPECKVVVEPLGADFSAGVGAAWRSHEQPLHFVFAGALRRLKGIDFILDAATQLYAEGYPLQVTFAGGLAESEWLPKIQKCPVASYVGSLSQKSLFDLLRQCDCLLLPSRFDSFGMVVAEAMACGMPAIVSSQVGAKIMIESQRDSGWIVEPNSEALKTCMRALILDRARLFGARAGARQAAANYSWAAYRHRVAQRIKGWLL